MPHPSRLRILSFAKRTRVAVQTGLMGAPFEGHSQAVFEREENQAVKRGELARTRPFQGSDWPRPEGKRVSPG